MQTTTYLADVRSSFRVWIQDALARYTFTPVGGEFLIRDCSTGAEWISSAGDTGITFTLVREMD